MREPHLTASFFESLLGRSHSRKRQLTGPTGRKKVRRPKDVTGARTFFFFILKKTKFQKYMSVLKNFKNTPGRPMKGRQGSCRPSNERQDPNVIFFGICKEVPDPGEGACRPPQGRQGLSPPGSPSLYKSWPRVPSHLSLKIQKKERGEEKKPAKLCRIPHL